MKIGKLLLALSLGVIIILGIIFWVGPSELLSALAHFPIAPFIIALALFYLNFIVRAIRWRILLHGVGERRVISKLYLYVLIGRFVPLGGGDVLRAMLVRKKGKPTLSVVLGTVATEKGLDLLVVTAMLIAFAALVGGTMTRQAIPALAIAIVLLCLIVLGVWLFPRISPLILRRLHSPFLRKAVSFLSEMIDSCRKLAMRPTIFIPALLLTTLFWLLDIAMLYTLIIGVERTFPLLATAFTDMIMALVSSIPLLPGAVGQLELSALLLLTSFGMSKAAAGTVILLSNIITFWTLMIVSGAAAYALGAMKLIGKVKDD